MTKLMRGSGRYPGNGPCSDLYPDRTCLCHLVDLAAKFLLLHRRERTPQR